MAFGVNTAVIWGIALFSLFISIFWIRVYLKRPEIPRNVPDEWPLVSIIVPAYNEEDTIQNCIESLLDLDYPRDKLEVIVVNDGSTDATEEKARTYQNRTVTVYSKENEGKGAAVNHGLEPAKGEYVVSMDADSFAAEDAFKKLVSGFTSEDVGAVTAAMKIHEPGTIMQKLQAVEYFMAIWLRRQMGLTDTIQAIPGPFSMYRKSVLDEVGYFDEDNLTEDGEMAMRLHYYGYKIHNIPDADIYTVGPPTVKGLAKQRLRWYRGLFQNSVTDREMMFDPVFGNFGLFYMPLMWMSVFVLLASFSLFFWNIGRFAVSMAERLQLAGLSYFIPDFADFRVFDFVLGVDYLIIIPILLTFVIGVQVLKYSFEASREDVRGNLWIIFLYMLVYFFFLAGFWILSFLEELLRIDRDW
jgi:cellulose synthase/poly-beta-1,6-N-acetylglucosamine synthase-like glycosyltransferase